MIIGDEAHPRRIQPLVTYGLIALNVLVFFLELSGGDNFIIQWSFVPSRFLSNPAGEIITIFSSMFMHADYLHIGSNMLYLWIFGDNVEDRFGHATFLVFYLICGVAATLAQFAVSMNSSIPNLGASGAIAGVLGAYLVLFPGRRVNILLGRYITQTNALAAIGIWFALQLLSGIGTLGAADQGGVAYMAHIGGFVTGFVLTWVFARGMREIR